MHSAQNKMRMTVLFLLVPLLLIQLRQAEAQSDPETIRQFVLDEAEAAAALSTSDGSEQAPEAETVEGQSALEVVPSETEPETQNLDTEGEVRSIERPWITPANASSVAAPASPQRRASSWPRIGRQILFGFVGGGVGLGLGLAVSSVCPSAPPMTTAGDFSRAGENDCLLAHFLGGGLGALAGSIAGVLITGVAMGASSNPWASIGVGVMGFWGALAIVAAGSTISEEAMYAFIPLGLLVPVVLTTLAFELGHNPLMINITPTTRGATLSANGAF